MERHQCHHIGLQSEHKCQVRVRVRSRSKPLCRSQKRQSYKDKGYLLHTPLCLSMFRGVRNKIPTEIRSGKSVNLLFISGLGEFMGYKEKKCIQYFLQREISSILLHTVFCLLDFTVSEEARI